MGISIVNKTSTTNTSALSSRSITYIVIHYTAGTSSKKNAAVDNACWFNNAQAKASADYIVDDELIVQKNPDIRNRYCWAVGGSKYSDCGKTGGGSLYGIATNKNCISIEICSTNDAGKITTANDSHYSFTAAAVTKAVELTKYLMKEYSIDAAHVIRHFDVNGKPCPGVKGWGTDGGDDSSWKSFKTRISGSTAATAIASATTETSQAASSASVTSTTSSNGGFDMAKLNLLKKGSKGAEVKALQILLIGYGYSCGKCGADADFGTSTDNAVRAYQEASGLTKDGQVGPKTWASLLGA